MQPLQWDMITIWFSQINWNTWPSSFGLSWGKVSPKPLQEEHAKEAEAKPSWKLSMFLFKVLQASLSVPGWSICLCWKPAWWAGPKFEDFNMYCTFIYYGVPTNKIICSQILRWSVLLACGVSIIETCFLAKADKNQQSSDAGLARHSASLLYKCTTYIYIYLLRQHFVAKYGIDVSRMA